MGSRGREDTWQVQPRVPEQEKKASKPPVGVVVVEETLRLTGELFGETHRVLECTQTHPPEISTRMA